VVGTPDFVCDVLERDTLRRVRIARFVTEGMTPERLQKMVTDCIRLADGEDFFRQGRMNEISTARRLFVRLGVLRYDFSCADLARHMKMSRSAVSRMVGGSARIDRLDYLLEMMGL